MRNFHRASSWRVVIAVAATFLGAMLNPAHAAAPPMALQGNFVVNAAGAANYSFPVVVPPGTAGMVPNLSLNYSSQAGDGFVGWQWALGGLPSVGRCARTVAQDSVHGGVNYDSNDRFCIDGQRLILYSGTYGASGSEYRTETETFSRIIAHGTAGTGPAWFEVHTKSGQTLEFGNTTDSALLAVGTSTVRAWAVDKITDTKGNYFTVTYTNDGTNGQIYPSRIDYTGNAGASVATYNSVQFTYTTRSDITPMYQAGSLMQMTVLLTHIKTYNGASVVSDYQLGYSTGTSYVHSHLTSVTQCDAAGTTCLAPTSFTWQGASGLPTMTSTSISLAQGSSLTSGQYNGDGLTDVMVASGTNCGIWAGTSTVGSFTASLIKANYDVWDHEGGVFSHSYETNVPPCFSIGPYYGLRAVSDLNGDGYTDFVISQQHSLTLSDIHSLFNDKSTHLVQPWPIPPAPNPFAGLAPLAVADFNGDGRQDILTKPNSTGNPTVFLSGGTGGYSSSTSYSASLTLYVGDFDGDGCADILEQGSTSAIVYSCNPATSSVSVTNWTGAKIVVGDFNGDGKSDILVTYPSSTGTLYLSTGTGIVAQSFSVPAGWANYQILVGDWNGDGKADIALVANGGTTNVVYLSTGTGFVSAGTIANTNTADNPETAVVADWNNDGAQDIWLQRPSTGDALYTFAYVPELMTAVSNGIGMTASITYDRLNKNGSLYTKGSSASYPAQDLDGPFYVVSEVDTSNGIGGTYTQTYAYSGAVGNLGTYVYINGASSSPSYIYSGALAANSGIGAVAFAQIKMTDSQTGIVTTTNYNTSSPYLGTIASQTRVLSGVTLSSVTNTWQSIVLTTGTTRNFVYLHEALITGHDIDGSALPTTDTTYTYDCNTGTPSICSGTSPTGFGDLTQTASCTYSSGCSTDGISSTTTNTYTNDTTNWILGQLTASSTANLIGGGSSLTRSVSIGHQSGTGIVNQEIIEPSNCDVKLEADYTIDGFGNRTATMLSGAGCSADGYKTKIATRTSYVGYDANGLFPTSTTNALSQGDSTAFNAGYGGPTNHTDLNGLSSSATYDTLGRPTLVTKTDGTELGVAYAYCSGVNGGTASCPTYGAYLATVTPYAPGGSTQIGSIATTYYDALNRVIAQDSQGYSGANARVATQYDSSLFVHQVSRPYFTSGGTAKWTVYTNDALGRVTVATAPDSSTTTYGYHGLSIAATDGLSHTTTTVRNNQVLVASVTDATSHTTTYSYDQFANLLSVTDPSSNVISNTYDIRGNKLTSADPDLGSWSYVSDVLSELVSQVDAKSQTMTIGYDVLNRPTERDEVGMVSNWVYDGATHGVGLLQEECSSSSSNPSCSSPVTAKTFTYDVYSRPSSTAILANGGTQSYSTTYNSTNGAIDTVTYPSGLVQKKVYNSYGYLCRVADTGGTPTCSSAGGSSVFWTANTRDAENHLTEYVAGNGVVTDQSFDANTGLPTAITAGSSGTVASYAYNFDTVGNLINRRDNNQAYTEQFCYDGLNRLTTYSLTTSTSCPTSGTNAKTVAYDVLGNITSKSDLCGSPPCTYTYPASGPGSVRPHAVAQIAGTADGISSPYFAYDANGNMTCVSSGSGCTGTQRTISYTSFNMPSGLVQTGANIALSYDSEHLRNAQTATVSGTTTTTVYFNDPASGGTSEQISTGGSPIWTDYLVVDGQTFAQRVGGTWTYFTLDNLTSNTVLTNAGGSVTQTLSYDAWGMRRNANGSDASCGSISSATTVGYTNQEMMDSVCEVNLNARIYDPNIARFTSADPLVSDPVGAQGLNRYSYVENGPMSATDPSGYCTKGQSTCQYIEPPPPTMSGLPPESVTVPGYRLSDQDSAAAHSDQRSNGTAGGEGGGGGGVESVTVTGTRIDNKVKAPPPPIPWYIFYSPPDMNDLGGEKNGTNNPVGGKCSTKLVQLAKSVYQAGGVVSSAGGWMVATGATADAAAAGMAATGVGLPGGAVVGAAGTAVAGFGATGVTLGTLMQGGAGLVIWQQTGNWRPFASSLAPSILGWGLPVGRGLEGPGGDLVSGILDSGGPEVACH